MITLSSLLYFTVDSPRPPYFVMWKSILRRPRIVSALRATLFLAAAIGHQAALASPAGVFRLPDGFHAELVYEVPSGKQGSWIALTVDRKGRLIASDQNGALYRVTPSPLGASAKKTVVEQIPLNMGMAHGLTCAGDDLYVMLNGTLGSFSSGIYRLRDSNGDDQFDAIDQLRVINGQGEHGPHALVLSPDGKSIYLCCGNVTQMSYFERSQTPRHWGEDQLLPRLLDPKNHATSIPAPGGWIAKMDLEGENLELICVGFRNPYDMAFNDDGELFTFDADMEWDVGTPWYRPTRVCHVVGGADFGWRSGNGKWPSYFVDSLPAVIDVGPGSPTGVQWGQGTNFPAPYREVLFLADWSYGRIFAARLTPRGASYEGTIAQFASASPLGVTDMAVRPQDGALYLAVGGRKSLSALYRIVYDGSVKGKNKTDAPGAAATQDDPQAASLRTLRRRLEQEEVALDDLWPYLGHADRFVRYAARVALEKISVDQWFSKAIAEQNAAIRLPALTAAARMGDKNLQTDWGKALTDVPWSDLSHEQRLDWVRTAALGAIRFDSLNENVRKLLRDAANPRFPSGKAELDRELSHLLVHLRAPQMASRLLKMLASSDASETAIDLAVALSEVRDDWTLDQRRQLLDWFDAAAEQGGGKSSFPYVVAARNRFVLAMSDDEKKTFGDRITEPFVGKAAQLESVSRPLVKEWSLDELVKLAQSSERRPNFEAGQRLFAAASCFQCHRLAGAGSSIGPDLTGAGRRFSMPDLLRTIVDPSFDISDQYQQMVFEINGKVLTGRISNLNGDQVAISTNMLDPKASFSVQRSDIDFQYPSKVSMMPKGLLNTLTGDEIIDLLAYLRSGGDPQSEVYAPSP